MNIIKKHGLAVLAVVLGAVILAAGFGLISVDGFGSKLVAMVSPGESAGTEEEVGG